MSGLKILIAAGGTGGHIYPALAIAEAFRRKRRDVQIEFVGTAHGLENKIIPANGYPLRHLPVGRLNANVSRAERVRTLLRMPLALWRSARLLRAEKPDFVLGVGGHASGPLLLVATLLNYRTAIWEPNAMPGLANRWLAPFVDDCWVVFNEAKVFLKNKNLHQAGMPVRKEIACAEQAQRPKAEFHILVFGGSQGARGINNVVAEMLTSGAPALNGLKVVHQTGSGDFARLREIYAARTDVVGRVEVREYLDDMDQQYARADLVICRSGTGTLSELAACARPAILIPLPTASDDHQRKNAESFVRKGAARMILQKELTVERLTQEIQELRRHPEKLDALATAVQTFHQPFAAEFLVDGFLERLDSRATR